MYIQMYTLKNVKGYKQLRLYALHIHVYYIHISCIYMYIRVYQMYVHTVYVWTYTSTVAPQPTCLAAEMRPSDHREFFL